ncbi:cytochrome c biogenesis protein/redoxin (plasmid) [Cetobacterium somerae]|uniref:cytochrome c biogenesis protein/redoxin n=1 Tax=Cetobacterium somerae TaxID=188913 RepID=UPI002E7BDFE5|nr:cytochrome c biogenesis protein/redoxin [Cetobacterium somerae]WVJ03184.1 cytochrome c biogenesis protein/redoxin [Cetobacterium somerae]
MEVGLLFYSLTFLGGFISFFSPCVIPIIPIYFSFLAGNGKKSDCYGNISYNQKKVFFNTLFFIFGISTSFFILGVSFTTIGDLAFSQKDIISKIGGVIIIILGLFQLGIIKLNPLYKEKRIAYSDKKITPFVAFITGFTFSFAWTPCVGPILSSVLILAATLKDNSIGNLLIFIYSLGFVIPFLLIGLFTTTLLNFFKSKQNFLKYTVKIAGGFLVIIGTLTFLGYTNQLSNYFIPSTLNGSITNNTETILNKDSYRLLDQYGNEHILSNYKGKVVFLNFWATWCPPCKEEMPTIEELYKEFGENKNEVIILGITNPVTEENPNGQDKNIDEIKYFLQENNYSFPTVFDKTGIYFDNFKIRAFPTTYIIGKDGEIKTAIPGAMTKQQMLKLIRDNI